MSKSNGGRTLKITAVAVVAVLIVTAFVVYSYLPTTQETAEHESRFIVSTGNDNEESSLRAALAAAENGSTIIIDPTVTKITLVSEITFSQSNITINGGPGVIVTKSNAGEFRLLNSTATTGTLTLKGLTFENGNGLLNGGAVNVSGNVSIINCVFTGNTSKNGNGGGVSAYSASVSYSTFGNNKAPNGNGGGIWVNSDSLITETIFIGNSAASGGAAYGNTSINSTRCSFFSNTAETDGSGIAAKSNITLKDSGFMDNDSVNGTVFSVNGKISADNSSFLSNYVSGTDVGVISVTEDVTLRHCTITDNRKADGEEAFNIYVDKITGTVSVANCILTKDELTGNINGGRDITAGNLLGDDDSSDHAAWFDNNTLTFNYVMPLPGVAGGATPIPALLTDAAGNTRTAGSCLFGAVNWSAKSWMVTANGDGASPGPTGSLRWAEIAAETYNTAPLPDKRVVYFDKNMEFNIKLTAGQITFTKDIMVVGRLGINGQPEITVDGGSSSRIFADGNTSPMSYFYGMTLKNGKASGSSGGAIYSGTTSIYAQHCIFINNSTAGTGSTSGGAISATSGTATAVNCTFIGNTCLTSGGAVYASSQIYLKSCIFIGNIAQNHGGVSYTTSHTTATDCVIIGNKATTGSGGGIRTNGVTTATGCIFIGNTAAVSGGGVYSGGNGTLITVSFFSDNTAVTSGGGLYVSSVATVSECQFYRNSSASGGGVNASGTASTNYVHVYKSVFNGNTAAKGSGLNNSGGPFLDVTNCTFNGNTSTGDGGAISCAIYSYLFHVTVTDNKGTGVFADAGMSAYLYDCIAAGNTNGSGESSQTAGNVNYIHGSNLIEGVSSFSYEEAFGLNYFDPDTNTHRVLTGGIAAGTAPSVQIADVYTTGLTTALRNLVVTAVGTLNKDQLGEVRPTSGNVTYGAVESSVNSLKSIAVTTNPSKMNYSIGEAIDLTGTQLTLTFMNGTESNVPYDKEGITNTSSAVNTSTVGSKPIDFSLLGVTTTPGTRLNVTVEDGSKITVTSGGSVSVGEEAVFYALVEPENAGSGVPSGTVTFYSNGNEIGTADLDSGTATLRVSDLPAGNHTIKAVYGGDAYYSGSESELDGPFTVNTVPGTGNIRVTGWTYGMARKGPVVADPNSVGYTVRYRLSTETAWTTLTTAVFPILNAGTYSVQAIFNASGSLSEYTASTTFVVQKAKLTVKADDKSKLYGHANPSLTYTITGYAYNDDESVITGVIYLDTTATADSLPGEYPITMTGSLTAVNYTFEFKDGVMKITTEENIQDEKDEFQWKVPVLLMICALFAIAMGWKTRKLKE